IDSSNESIGELLAFSAKLYVDTLLVKTSEPAHLRVISDLPALPKNLRFTDFGNLSGKLEWDKSASADITEYNIYTDSGSGIINFDTPFAVILADTLFYFIDSLIDTDYRFVARAKNNLGVEEKNKNVLVVRPIYRKPIELPEIKISSPVKNQKVSGNNFQLIAEADELTVRIFESTQWAPRAMIENSAKTNPAKKGNPNDYMEFIDVGNQTIVNVYTTEINPFLFLDDNFVAVTPNNENNAIYHQLEYKTVADSGYLWSVTVPKIDNGDKIYIKQSGSRSKNFRNLNIKVGFEISKLLDSSSNFELTPELYQWNEIISADNKLPNPAVSHPWTTAVDLSTYISGNYLIRIRVYYDDNGSETSIIADMLTFEVDHINWTRKDEKTNDNKTKTTEKLSGDDTTVITTGATDDNGNKTTVSVTAPDNIID
ncbi:MAG TPA: hypothetical protein PLM75_13085, partial [bacterium]|nr:hypothetical protein [bacterium]